jgi:hypothetical protein
MIWSSASSTKPTQGASGMRRASGWKSSRYEIDIVEGLGGAGA